MTETAASPAVESRSGSAGEMFLVALRLGLTSFGGPIAHFGYFERTYVRERRWLTADEYAGLVALCQMVPGPASSQVSYLIGLRRAGWGGAFAAWAGFTLPSALVRPGRDPMQPRQAERTAPMMGELLDLYLEQAKAEALDRRRP
jgi:chromate transporter